jgi:phosphopantothenoylcysteine decarboxylase/phosphopantothenate--cysteine ligase
MKNVVLAVSGGIAAYKSAEITSRLKKSGFNVDVIMTHNAEEFITPLTLETMSGRPVVTDTFDRRAPWEVEHISLAKKADIFVVAPATANVIGKLANGIADDMLTTTAMAVTSKVLIAPAMNNAMYKSTAVQENIKKLKERGFYFVGPESGLLACGDDDIGRMSEPEKIVGEIKELLEIESLLLGKRVLVTAGPTKEKIDPVRFISNHSTGKMGYALAAVAVEMGANVTLVSGPTNLPSPNGVDLINVETTQQMYDAVTQRFDECDAYISAAAPSDFKPQNVNGQKIKKSSGMEIKLIQNPDIAKTVGKAKTNQKIVIFAAESENLIENAKEKLKKKNADMVVANDITKKGAGFGADTNIASIIKADGEVTNYPIMTKEDLAKIILEELSALIDK